MNKPVPPDKEDLAFFREAMKDVKRTKSFHGKNKQKKIITLVDKAKLINLKDENQQISIALFDPTELNIGSEDRLFFSRPGLQNKRIKHLTQGGIRQSDYLDLHQMTVDQARRAVLNFLLHSREHNYTCVRIIHGKGKLNLSGAKLKNHVNCWLMQIPWVLAFSSAQPRDGGAGALYVLLRRNHHVK
ncbi:Smr/MutS family protein [Rickettsiella endosymbiont of Miltochrista miniata]|uniref:Smr/MutS family protein n=1 Tax=Rickettsiella endosymbiont of Miltochrista miniata TaxID=3066239 RepID=UPI00313B469E